MPDTELEFSSRSRPRPVIAHCSAEFFARSETFIYSYVRSMRRFRPICVATTSPEAVNLDQFPFPSGDLYTPPPEGRIASSWLGRRIRRRLRDKLLQVRWLSAWARRRTVDHRWIAAVLRKRNARLIHAHFGPTGWDLLPAKRQLGLPLVTTFYGFDTAPQLEWEGPGWAERRQELFEQGDLFLVEGPAMRQKLLALGCPAQKVQIQRIAIPVGRVTRRSEADEGSNEVRPTTVLFAGRFVEKKGLEYALDAIRQLVDAGVDLEFRVIGDGPLLSEVQDFIHVHQLRSAVRLLGFVPHAILSRELQCADIFLHPSVTAANGDNEGGAPSVILEAQEVGLPVVATDHADIPYITRPGESALLVPERDSAALAESLRSVIEQPELRRAMGKVGQRHVRASHDIRTEVRSLERKYADLLGGDYDS